MNPITEIVRAFVLVTIISEILVFSLWGIYCGICKLLGIKRSIDLG